MLLRSVCRLRGSSNMRTANAGGTRGIDVGRSDPMRSRSSGTDADGARMSVAPLRRAGCTARAIPALCMTGSGYRMRVSGPQSSASAHAREL